MSNAGILRAERWLVRGIDLSVSRGEIVTLIGPNGSGKSTTVKMALNILPLSEGKVERYDDLKIGYVPQKPRIEWSLPLTVRRFLALNTKCSTKEAQSNLERCGVGHLGAHKLTNLSGGEFQRVLLARAITRNPNLLVLDEPAQGVDLNGQIALYELISEIKNELDCGVLLVSHDLHFVMAATDKVICLNGHICCSGSAQSVAQSPQYRELFGERATKVLAYYEHQHDHEHLPDGRVRHADGTISNHCDQEGHNHAQ